jgi:predicted transcriptional regulator
MPKRAAKEKTRLAQPGERPKMSGVGIILIHVDGCGCSSKEGTDTDDHFSHFST